MRAKRVYRTVPIRSFYSDNKSDLSLSQISYTGMIKYDYSCLCLGVKIGLDGSCFRGTGEGIMRKAETRIMNPEN